MSIDDQRFCQVLYGSKIYLFNLEAGEPQSSKNIWFLPGLTQHQVSSILGDVCHPPIHAYSVQEPLPNIVCLHFLILSKVPHFRVSGLLQTRKKYICLLAKRCWKVFGKPKAMLKVHAKKSYFTITRMSIT